MEGMGLTPLESNLHKYDPVIISQIIKMIEMDIFWHHKTFKSVLSTSGTCRWKESVNWKIHPCAVRTVLKITKRWMESK